MYLNYEEVLLYENQKKKKIFVIFFFPSRNFSETGLILCTLLLYHLTIIHMLTGAVQVLMFMI